MLNKKKFVLILLLLIIVISGCRLKQETSSEKQEQIGQQVQEITDGSTPLQPDQPQIQQPARLQWK